MTKTLMGFNSFCFILLGAMGCAADTVSLPKRLFGLGDVKTMAISPDLQYLATGGQGGAFLWNVENATLRRRLEGSWSATALAFAPDSKILASASAATIMTWDTETGVRIREFAGHRGEIGRLQFSRDGRELISASADNTVRIWSTESGVELHSIRTPGSPIIDCALSPDGRRLATVDTFLTNCVKIWDLATETQLRALPKTNWTAHRCLFTPAGELMTTGSDGSVLLWNAETAEPIRSFPGISGPGVFMLDLWFPNENSLAAACDDGRVFLWNLESAELLRVVPGEPVIAALGVPYDFLTIAAHTDYNIRIRQLPGGDTLRTFKGHTTSVHAGVAFSPDGRYVLSGGTESATRLWDRQSGRPVREFAGSPAGTMAASFSPDGSRVLTTVGLPHPGARLWKTETGELEHEFSWTGSWPMSAVFSPDGRLIAARSQGEAIRIFDGTTGALRRTLPNAAWGGPIAFSPNAPLLAAASTDFGADLYNYESGQLLHTFSGDFGPVVSVAFSPSGDTLMVAWQDGFIRLYNTFTMEQRREFPTAAAFLETAAYSPDGQFILTGEGWPAFTATLWDALTAQPLRTFRGHQWSVSAVAFSSDGTSILTGADLVREWSISSLAARLRVEKLTSQLRLTWSSGQLEQAPTVNGAWHSLTNATSPYLVPCAGPACYYRVSISE